MKYMDKYDGKLLEDGNFMFSFVPVQDYNQIFVCVNEEKEEDLFTIFDGGSLVASLRVVYNFKSKEFLNSVVDICKKYSISKKGNVFFLQCKKIEFEKRLDDFVKALNEICKI